MFGSSSLTKYRFGGGDDEDDEEEALLVKEAGSILGFERLDSPGCSYVRVTLRVL